MDERLFRQLYGEDGSPAVLAVMVGLTLLGSGWMMLGLLPLVAWKSTRRFAIALFATFCATGLAVFVLKAIIRRPRPCNALAGCRGLFSSPTDFSCPSGHAAGSFTFALFVVALCLRARRERPTSAPLLAISGAVLVLATAIPFSRVYLGAHYPGDVLAGAIVGGAIGLAGARGYASPLASGGARDTK